MAYGAKFHWQFTYPDGSTIELLISEKGRSSSATVFELGPLQGLSLEIGGGSAAVYEPVVKTTLRFTLADEWDKGQTYNGESSVTRTGGSGSYSYTKHGRWEEFYTNDATQFLVQLLKDGSVIWSGFVTPDNWREDLYYHGSVTIVARDMLGTLSDVEFAAPNNATFISVQGIIQAAVEASQAVMSVSASSAYHLSNTESGTSILLMQLGATAFEGKTWWEVLTSVLESLGMVMRYNGANGWDVVALRYLPEVDGSAHSCEFVSHSGVRELQSPIRDITGVFDFDIIEKALVSPAAEAYSSFGNVTTIADYGIDGVEQDTTAAANISGAQAGDWSVTGSANRPSIIAPKRDSFGGVFPLSNSPYFICNTGKKDFIGYHWIYGQATTVAGAIKGPCKLRIAQDGPLAVLFFGDYYTDPVNLSGPEVALESVLVYISAGGYYYNGNSWVQGTEKTGSNDTTAGALDPMELDISSGVAEVDIHLPSSATLPFNIVVNIVHVRRSNFGSVVWDSPVFAPLRVSMLEVGGSSEPTEFATKLSYNPNYNVNINRTPAVGSATSRYPAELVPNLLSFNGKIVRNAWTFSDTTPSEDDDWPLEVMVQAQLLVYYASQASLFSGTLHDKTVDVACPGTLFGYKSRSCILLRGTFNFATGYIEGVSMLEYNTWPRVWGTFSPVWSAKGSRGSGKNGGSSGGSSPVAGGGDSGSVTELRERIAALEALIGEEALTHAAYVKPYDNEGVDTAREFKNEGGGHFRDLTLAAVAEGNESETAVLEVVRVQVGQGVYQEYLHTRLPFYSDSSVAAGGIGQNGGGGGGGSTVTWQTSSHTNYAMLRVANGSTTTDKDVALWGHGHAISDVSGLQDALDDIDGEIDDIWAAIQGGGGGGTFVEWGTVSATGFQQLKVAGDTTHVVALSNHGHAISDISNLQDTLDSLLRLITAMFDPLDSNGNVISTYTAAALAQLDSIKAKADFWTIGSIAAGGANANM